MSKTARKNSQKPVVFLRSAVIALALLCMVLVVFLLKVTHQPAVQVKKRAPSVSLQMLEYNIVDNKAVKISNEYTDNLRTYLTHKALDSKCPVEDPPYENVVAYTSDRKQILLAYGCGGPTASMYIVLDEKGWRSISPTNNFDGFGLPYCEFVAANDISREIAPVCAQGNSTSSKTTTYTVR